MDKNIQKGFTLIELLVVIAIISLLSSVVLASVNEAREKAKISRARADLQQIYTAFMLYVNDHGYGPKQNTPNDFSVNNAWNIPNCDDGINDGVTDMDDIVNNSTLDRPNAQFLNYYENELSPYLTIPKDPWGNEYIIDAVYDCDEGQGAVGCPSLTSPQKHVFAIHSPGPNASIRHRYDADNVVLALCIHPN